MAVADTRSSLVITKEFGFKGGTKRYANRYHVTGPETLTLAEFEVLADAVMADEADAIIDVATIKEASWSDASTATSTNPHGITTHSKSVTIPGNLSITGGPRDAGECATFIRYATDARTSKNHPIYLFNYYHPVAHPNAGPVDQLIDAQKTALEEYGTDWIAGFSDGTNTRVRCGPRGAVAQSRSVPQWITHRDFPK